MKFVVTGSTGFLGLEFVTCALQNGHEVFAVARNIEKAKTLLPDCRQLHIIQSSLPEFKNLDKQIPRADVFVNFAWDGITVAGRDMIDVQTLNIQYATEAMAAAKRMGCSVFVETGSQAEYGIVETEITEETPCHPFSEYGKAKLALLNRCFELSHQIGIKYLHTRIFSVFGNRDHEHTLVHTCVEKLKSNEPIELSACTQNWNFLYVKDAVKQILLLSLYAASCASFQSDVYNIASEDTRILRSFVEEMKSFYQSSSELLFGAASPNRVVTLNPNINKLKNAIGFVSDYTFSAALKDMNYGR